MIDSIIELRRAPFLFWIRDLSQPDHLFPLPFTVLGATHFNLLPIVMTATWFVQSLTAPRSPDPQMEAQRKMFLIMPVMFGFLCYEYASGLSLYFFVNSLLGIAEQKTIKKYFLKPAS
jgi:YidC/Oxa1 family membrane protein insertase